MNNNNNEKIQLDISENNGEIIFKFTNNGLEERVFTYPINQETLSEVKVDTIRLDSNFYNYMESITEILLYKHKQVHTYILIRCIKQWEQLENLRNTNAKKINFSYIFLKPINFDNMEFTSKTSFDRSFFQDIVSFNNSTFKDKVSFNNVIFNSSVVFTKTTFNSTAYFKYAIFNNKNTFIATTFKSVVNFRYALFNGITRFKYTNFYGNANFKHTIFNYEAYFTTSIFEKIAYFNNATFKDEISFKNTTIKSRLDINSTRLVYLWLNDTKIDELRASNTLIEELIIINKNIINKKGKTNTTSYRLLKDQAIKQNNRTLAWEFYKLEMNTKDWSKNPILLFNWLTNQHGTSSLLAIFCFFVILILGSYVESYLFHKNFGETILSYNPLILAQSFKCMSLLQSITHFCFTVLLLSLIWQLLQAFRRYSKMP
ncbi:MAG: pentapeptide repeat-containing protein [Alphaproteobacteria bacterium]|jgi:hypothetical protein|nr:pentapeptide repeat-containing protein [Alphaproteobacteria bacterium]